MFDSVRYLKRGRRSEGRCSKPRQHRSGQHRRLLCETLEARTLLSACLAQANTAAQQQTLSDLPAAAQQAISSAIGQDQAAYHAATASSGVTLANPANGFNAQVQSGALQVSAGSDTWDMSLVGLGYGGTVQPVGTAKTSTNGNRVDCNYGAIDEWYVNGPSGLEQGFTVPLPRQSNASGLLTVELALGGDLKGTVNATGDGLTLTGPDGSTALGYTGLSACDATGKALPASLEVQIDSGHQELLIHINDAGAQGPITIDPFVQEAKLTASDGVRGDGFGNSVSISGNTLVVGAPGATTTVVNGVYQPGPGAAYVFTEPASGWADMTQTAKLTASDGAAGDDFGYSVSISGNTVVIGADNAIGGNSHKGAAYVFTEPASGWVNMTQTAKLTASDVGGYYEWFGRSVSIGGNTVVVGDSGEPGPKVKSQTTNEAGAAYVFTEPASGWKDMTQTAKLTASDPVFGAALGHSVSINQSGNTVVAGASEAGSAAAYVFTEPASGWANMTQTAELTNTDGSSGSNPVSISASGNTVVFGEHTANAAYVFTEPASGWANMTETAKLTASDGSSYDDFGSSVSINESGNTVVVGATNATVGGNLHEGAAYVFTGSGSVWTQTDKLTASDGATYDRFSSSVAISGNTVVVGAYQASVGSNQYQGAAYVYVPTPLWVTGVSSTAGTYGLGSTIPITVQFSEPVTVSTAMGTPQLTLNDGGMATYAGGSGTSTLTFNYIVAPGQNTTDLDYASITALALDGGSIVDAAGNATALTLPLTGSDGLARLGIVVYTLPTVTGVSPTSGPTAGGTSVTITGSGFTGGGQYKATAVTFGTVAASSFTVNSDTQITATSPAGMAGTVYVTVAGPGGPSTPSSADQFTYIGAPTVTRLSPTSGTTAGGTSVTITGSNFTGATLVDFGTVAASSFTVVSATQITATSPAESAATVYVTVTTAGGTSTTSSGDKFTYTKVKGAIVSAATLATSTSVTIAAASLSGATPSSVSPASAVATDTSDQQRKKGVAILALEAVFAQYNR